MDSSEREGNRGRQRVQPGPVGRRVPREVRRLREQKRWSTYRLSHELDGVGWLLRPPAITRMEGGHRGVTVDDLAALAAALDVSPITLMLGQPTGERKLITPSLDVNFADWLSTLPMEEQVEDAVVSAVKASLRQMRERG